MRSGLRCFLDDLLEWYWRQYVTFGWGWRCIFFFASANGWVRGLLQQILSWKAIDQTSHHIQPVFTCVGI